MDTGKLKKFAQAARRELIQQIAGKLKQILAEGSLARREQAAAVVDLERQIQAHGRDEVIERAAYTWFNRFAALRFMDAHRYNRIMTVSPAEEQTQPEILAEAKQGHIDEGVVPEKVRERVFALLDGRTPSRDAQGEAYRLLLVAVCNYWHHAMPFLFERIADWTELLMPDDLMSDSSVRTRIRTVLSADDCQDVEVIGWLYQFYISEKKDEVFAGLKKGKKISAENIPAATQLFTPHWIVRYLVENSLGRLWQLNRPNSRLAERMDYYIAPEEPETDFLKIGKPQDIKLCDPACGSGHMLTYAFDLLYAIYEEEGYAPDDIPALILEHNLTGIEIDERAGALAAFALAMKAAEKLGRRKLLKLAVQPNIVVLQDVRFGEDELKDYMVEVGRDLFTADLTETLGQFEQATNFGSLIQPVLKYPTEVQRVLESKDFEGNLFLSGTHRRVLDVLQMSEALSPKYHVVMANPPYLNASGMNSSLKSFIEEQFKEYKSDCFSAFVVRSLSMSLAGGYSGFMTPFVWMFISSHEELRNFLYQENTVISLVKPSYTAFFQSAIVPICAFVVGKIRDPELLASYFDLGYLGGGDEQPQRFLDAKAGRRDRSLFFRCANALGNIPGRPVSFWASDAQLELFGATKIKDYAKFCEGITTGDNDRFLRRWHEVSLLKNECSFISGEIFGKWRPYNKGGAYRKWYGNNEFLVNWGKDGADLKAFPGSSVRNLAFQFKEGATFSAISSSNFGIRFSPAGFSFDSKGTMMFAGDALGPLMSYMNSKAFAGLLGLVSPTMDFRFGTLQNLPFIANVEGSFTELVDIGRRDWDAYETSWDCTSLPLLSPRCRAGTLDSTYARLRTHWESMTNDMQRLEEENNRIFIEAYGLQDELSPEVPIEEITLNCNPAYRYGVKISEEEREQRLLADTMAELLSYAVGCMFGRYSLDKPGLVLANQGETLADYLAQVPEPSFLPDEDNVIPILDADWFTDDITERFREFLRLTFGAEHFQENLEFIEQALGKTIRKYFLKDFYKGHVQRYKKRPIYWLFSSPKGSFNALIYMHRYRPDTVSVILNEYLREFITKLGARIQQLEQIEASASTSARDKTAALKEIKQLRDTLSELQDWERKVLLPLASERIEIDLDDGVKANYPKFGSVLAQVPGLSE